MYTPKSNGRRNDAMVRHQDFIEFIAERCKDAKEPRNINQLIRVWKEQTGSDITQSALTKILTSYRQRIPRIRQLDRNTKVRLMFALKAEFDEYYVKELREHAEVEVNAKTQKLISYKAKDGSLRIGRDRPRSMTQADRRKSHRVQEEEEEMEEEEEEEPRKRRSSSRLQQLKLDEAAAPKTAKTPKKKAPAKLGRKSTSKKTPKSYKSPVAPVSPSTRVLRSARKSAPKTSRIHRRSPVATLDDAEDPVAEIPENSDVLPPNSADSGAPIPPNSMNPDLQDIENSEILEPDFENPEDDVEIIGCNFEHLDTPIRQRQWKLEVEDEEIVVDGHFIMEEIKPLPLIPQMSFPQRATVVPSSMSVKMEDGMSSVNSIREEWNEIISLETHKNFLESIRDLIQTLELPIPRKIRRRIENTIDSIKHYGTRAEDITSGEIHTAATSCLLIISKSARPSSAASTSSQGSTSLREFLLFFKSAIHSMNSPIFYNFLKTLKSIAESRDKEIPLDKVQSALETIINIVAP